VAEAADQTHAVQLARALLEAADEHHLAVEAQQILFRGRRRIGDFRGFRRRLRSVRWRWRRVRCMN
jgi:hypothetical protein